MNEIQRLLKESERVVVITHTHADLDSVGSAVGFVATLNSSSMIATPDGVQSGALKLLEDYNVEDDPDLTEYDLQIVVDAPSTQRIAPLDPTAIETPLVVIDHHTPGDLQDKATATYIDTAAPSTATLVTRVLQNSDWSIAEPAAMALAAGILDDTGFRGIVMPDVQDDLLMLLDRAGDYSTQLSTLWEADPSLSERVATAKAIVRSRGYKAGDVIVLISEVGSQETAAAHALLGGNGDIGIVISERSSQTRVVARRSERIGGAISLPEDVLKPLAAEYGGYAGGHSGAAVAKLEPTSAQQIEDAVMQCIEESMGLQFGRLS